MINLWSIPGLTAGEAILVSSGSGAVTSADLAGEGRGDVTGGETVDDAHENPRNSQGTAGREYQTSHSYAHHLLKHDSNKTHKIKAVTKNPSKLSID